MREPAFLSNSSRRLGLAALLTAACAAFSPATFVSRASAEDPPAPPMQPPMQPPGTPATPPPTDAPPPVSSRFIDTYDANQDGKVTKEEFTGDVEVFSLLDKDGDGVVTNVELGLPTDYRPRPLPPPPSDEGPGMKGGNMQKRLEEFKAKLAEWDTDKDGKVTKEEYKGKIPFDYADRNKDGVISMEDLRGGGKGIPGMPGMPGEGMNPEAMAARFKEADKNGDGKVTKDEFPGPAERFAMLDKDGDGAVTQEEMTAAMRAGGPGGPGEKGGKRLFQRFDKNGDGKVARDEFPGGDAAFQGMDKNGDGFLTTDEVEAMAGKKPGKGGEPGKPGQPGQPGAPTTPDGMPMPGGDGVAHPPPGGFGGLFAALDRDHDGRLSRAEFPGGDDEWRKLDRDGNGWITPDEAGPK